MSRSNNARVRMKGRLEIMNLANVYQVARKCHEATCSMTNDTIWFDVRKFEHVNELELTFNQLLQDL